MTPSAALAQSKRSVEDLPHWQDEVDRVVDKLRWLQQENHFQKRLEKAYGTSR